MLGAASAVGAYAALQYQDRTKLEGIGATRFRRSARCCGCSRPIPGNLGSLRVRVDGEDLSSFASTDARGVVVQGAALRDGRHRVRISASSSGIFGTTISRTLPDRRRHPPPDARDPGHPGLPHGSHARRPHREGRDGAGALEGRTARAEGADRPFSIDPPLPDGRYALRITRTRSGRQRLAACAGSGSCSTRSRRPSTCRPCRASSSRRRPSSTGSVDDMTPSTLQRDARRPGDRPPRQRRQPAALRAEGHHALERAAAAPQRGRARPDADARRTRRRTRCTSSGTSPSTPPRSCCPASRSRSARAARTSPSSSAVSRARGSGRARRPASTTCAPPPPSSCTSGSTRCPRPASRTRR